MPTTLDHTVVLSPGPHLHAVDSTRRIMWTVNATLLPAIAWGAFVFGPRILLPVAGAVAGAVGGEWLAARLLRRPGAPTDGSAVCTGLLLAMTLPPLAPWWMAFLGGAFGILLGKMIFGGLGFNLFNPALIGRAFLMASFPLAMTAGWAAPRPLFGPGLEAATHATPLTALKEGGIQEAFRSVAAHGGPWGNLLLGFRSGSIGEVSVVLVTLGAAFLLWRGIISYAIPLGVFAGVALSTALSGAVGFHLLSGGLWLGAFYMATDYVTSPSTRSGQIVFGLLIGVLTGLIRMFGGYPEGICYAILIANAMVPAFNLWFRPRRTVLAGSPS
jgi:Na+-translocating ferredoxin:NAD+ oxidoreductase subunit D